MNNYRDFDFKYESLVSRLKLSSEFVDKAVRLTVAMGDLLSSVMFGITSDL